MITSVEEYKRYYDSDNEDIFIKIYEPAITECLWFEILEMYPECARFIVINRHVSANILEKLSTHKDTRVRFEVATKRRINRLTFERLALDNDSSIRAYLALNAKIPQDILEGLSFDSDIQVATNAQEHLERRLLKKNN